MPFKDPIMIKQYHKKYYKENGKDLCECGNIKVKESKHCIKCAPKFFVMSDVARKRLSINRKNEGNVMWKGDNVGYKSLHIWIKDHKPKPKLCEDCKKVSPYDLANISGEYKRDIKDFKWVCRSCHMKEDGRINNLKQYKEEKNGR